jgi:phosphoenolpyruvate carboxylase
VASDAPALDPGSLDGDLRRLIEALTSSIADLAGDEALALVLSLRDDAVALREGTLPGGRARLAERIASLDGSRLELVARAFTQWCHLLNSAEEQQRIRVLRRRDDGSLGDGLACAVAQMKAAGMSATEVQAFFDRALVMPVLTAHPTESRRRSILDHLAAVAHALDDLERPLGPRARAVVEGQLEDAVLALFGTEESRVRKPTPRDEIETAIEVFRRTLLEITPRVYHVAEAALGQHYPEVSWRLPPFLRWGSWVGGDRDGNPNVTAHVTRAAFERQRTLVLTRYLEDVEELGRDLSISSRRVAVPAGLADLEAALVRDRERYPEVAARARPRAPFEPWREKLWYLQHRLRATLARTDDGYVDADGYVRDLALLERTLMATGFARLANGLVRDCRRRAEVFGFHLASIDIRQHSSVHERVVDEILARSGRVGYAKEGEAARRRLLGELLSRPVQPVRDRSSLSDESQDLLATLDIVGRARREQGPRACERYIVSFTSDVSDLLEVAFLARCAGLAPGELRPVPLLEQLEDLERGAELAASAVEMAALRAEIGDELEIMIGYSDSSKQVGYVTAAVALRRAQAALAKVADRAGVTLTVFHGRGGAIGRGGGPESDAIRAQPGPALRGRLRVTEQGETVTARYARPEIAVRDLELTVGAVLLAEVDERRGGDAISDDVLGTAAGAALTTYKTLTADQDRLARYTVLATPIQQVAKLPIGSRPASRKAGLRLDDLRAIPWVFSWNQSRHGIPGWFGFGSAIEALDARFGRDVVRALDRDSRVFRTLVRGAELALIRADIDVAAEYARLADAETSGIFDLIRAEHTRAMRAFREILGHAGPFADRPHLAESVRRRNPYIDVLSQVQVELLRRLRSLDPAAAEADRLLGAVFTTIGGIAAGLQTAG